MITPGLPAPASQDHAASGNERLPLVTIIVPTWNSKMEIVDFLTSVKAQTYAKSSLEIIVVDNGSTDGCAGAVREWFLDQRSERWHRLELIELKTNKGIAEAYNVGFKSCSRESHAVLRGEADVVLEPDVIEKLCDVIRREHSVGIVGARGLLFGSDPPKLDHAASYINWWNGRLQRVDPKGLVDCDSVFGPTFLVRRTCIDEMQSFFPADRFLANELEFCTRVKRFGHRVVCEPTAVAYHKGARSTGHLDFDRYNYVSQRETTLFHLKYNPFPQKIICLLWNGAYCLKQAIKGRPMSLLGFRDGIRWWILRRPTQLPNASSISLTEWLEDHHKQVENARP